MYLVYAAFMTLGLLLGFLIGGSETPVVNVAIPALAGIVTAIMAATVNRSSSQDLMKVLENVQDKETSVSESIDYITKQAYQAARQIGIATLLFCLGYAGGITLGSWVRLSGTWARAFARLEAPWLGSESNLDFKARADWLVYQQKLQVAGAPKEQVNDMFKAYETAHTLKSRTPIKPWLTQGDSKRPSIETIVRWLALEPTLALAGLTDKQIRDLWPIFIASSSQTTNAQTPTQRDQGSNDNAEQTAIWDVPLPNTSFVGNDPCLLLVVMECPITETPSPDPRPPLLIPENFEFIDPSQLDRYYTAPSKVP